MNPELISQILTKLDEQEKEDGALPDIIEFYRKILRIHEDYREKIGSLNAVYDQETLRARFRRGMPLISSEDFSPEPSIAQEIFSQILDVFAGYDYLFGVPPEKLKYQDRNNILTGEVFQAWYTNQQLPSTLLDGVNEAVKRVILQTTLQPFLTGYTGTFSNLLEQEHWHRSYCPVCGGSPDISSLKGDTGIKWLMCSRCDTEWRYQRLECPFCENQEQSTLAFFSDDSGQYRLDVCNKCKGYLKSVDQRKFEGTVLMPLERLYTLDMDIQAAELGYQTRPEPASTS